MSFTRYVFRSWRCTKGRIIEVFGPESSGKTTLALHIVAECQNGGKAAFIDAENALDPEYAKNLDVTQMTYWFHSQILESKHLIFFKSC